MRYSLILALFCGSAVAILGQNNPKSANLEKTLWDADQQWLCISPPYSKPYKDCVAFRSKYWADQFFEVSNTGRVQTKAEMVAAQTAANPPTGVGAYPADFNLIAVYGNFAVATDHTDFKTEDATGKVGFTSDSRVLRLFVMEGGQGRPAAAALVPVIPAKPAASAQRSNSGIRKSPDPQLERQLAAIDQKWMESTRTKKLDYLKQLFTGEWAEIVGWSPTVTISKADALDALAKINGKPGQGVFPDEFKLMALYGDVALATDRRTRKWTDPSGHDVSTPHRGLLVFVKQNSEWRSAGGALVPIT
jgi:hypothetical protein